MNEKRTEPFQAYLSRIEELIDETPVQDTAGENDERLPLLDEALLSRLAQYAEEVSQDHPDQGWLIAKLIDTAASTQQCDPLIKAKAAWYLARAANHCAQPKWVLEAVSRAREGFAALNEIGWLAACDWQENALPWTKTNVAQAMNILKNALQELQEAGFEEFVPECRLSLANAQTLMGEFKDAKENIAISEAYYAAQGAEINQARCWLLEAGLLRRQSKIDDAFAILQKTITIFERTQSRLDIAKVHYQYSMLHLLRTDDLTIAIDYGERGLEVFESAGVDLWRAASQTNLGAIHMQVGNFQIANEYYQQARVCLQEHNVLGLLADNLNDSGKLSLLMDSPNAAVKQFIQAIALYQKLEMRLPQAITKANLGEAYGRMGRYQDALYHLEQAGQELEALESYQRIGTCERYTALIWLQLGQTDLANEHLVRAIDYYTIVQHEAYFTAIYTSQADISFRLGEGQKAIEYLRKSLDIAQKHGIKSQIALASRLLGEGYLQVQQTEDAEKYLKAALTESVELGLLTEEAACLVALGNYYLITSQSEKAKNSFDRAFELDGSILPEVAWRGFSGLAALAAAQKKTSEAMQAYRQGIDILSQIRQNFWQPSLAGSYLQTPAAFVDRAVAFGANSAQPVDTLLFIENSKTTTLFRQLFSENQHTNHTSQEINDLKAEIDWLQEKFRVSHSNPNPLRSAIHSRQIRRKLIQLTQQYDAAVAKQERFRSALHPSLPIEQKFSLDRFRELANQRINGSWLALDYYLTDDQLVIQVISADVCETHTAEIPARVRMSLDACNKVRQNTGSLLPKDLQVLGNWLIPSEIAKLLKLQTVLLLAPHRNLHGIPWAGLQPDSFSEPLAFFCAPVIAPSLQSFFFLWQRSLSQKNIAKDKGLVVGLSAFEDLKAELPSVKEEIAALHTVLGPESKFLLESDATWENLLALHSQGAENGLSDFSWLHIASHAYADVHSGRLSKIALWKGEMRLDQLRDLSPLPGLVTFSACNSIYSYIYEGDEHVGLPTTCFIAGAHRVVGSTWPVSDHAAAEFTAIFYRIYLDSISPAQAVAQAQKEMACNGEMLSDWAGFTCMGIP